MVICLKSQLNWANISRAPWCDTAQVINYARPDKKLDFVVLFLELLAVSEKLKKKSRRVKPKLYKLGRENKVNCRNLLCRLRKKKTF